MYICYSVVSGNKNSRLCIVLVFWEYIKIRFSIWKSCLAFFYFSCCVFFFLSDSLVSTGVQLESFNLGQMCLLILDISYWITAFRRLLSWTGIVGLMSQRVFPLIFPCSWIWYWVSLFRDDTWWYILITTTSRTWNCCKTISHFVLTIFWMLQSHIFMAKFLKFGLKINSAYLKIDFNVTYLLGCSCHLCFHLGICQ